MEDLTQKTIALTPKKNRFNRLEQAVCIPLNDEYSREIFMGATLHLTPKHTMTGKVVFHNVDENFGTVELNEGKLSLEIDFDLYNVKLLSQKSV